MKDKYRSILGWKKGAKVTDGISAVFLFHQTMCKQTKRVMQLLLMSEFLSAVEAKANDYVG